MNYQSRLAELEQQLSDPKFLKKQKDLSSVYEEYAEIKKRASLSEQIETKKEDIKENQRLIKESDDKELESMLQEDIDRLEGEVNDLTNALRELEQPQDPNDKRNVIVEIRAGSGGEEAALFASELFRMYSRYAESKGWQISLMNSNVSANGGFKEVIAEIQGKDVYKYLKHESGVHRVQRVPVTESSGRIHTSAASVVVLPQVEDVDIAIDQKDLRIDVFRSTGPGGQSVNTTDSAVRITHLPTGIVVSCQDGKSQLKNREKALAVLRSRLYDLEMQKQTNAIDSQRKAAIKTGDRSAKIRTYNFPQSRVTDHRIKQTWHNLQGILDGNLDEIIATLEAKMNLETGDDK